MSNYLASELANNCFNYLDKFRDLARYLTELHTALVKDSLDEQLEEAVPAGSEARLAQLPVCGDELRHHRTRLLEAVDTSRARVPVLELGVVGEAGQSEEETQLAVVVFGRAEFFQTVEALDGLLHGLLQLQREGNEENHRGF